MDIAQLVIDYHTQERPSTSGKLYPSSLGGCIRQEMMRWHNEHARGEIPYIKTHPMDAATLWKLKRYGWYEQAFACVGGVEQVDVESEWWHGKIDRLANGTILEVKSLSPYAPYESLPYSAHKYQVWAYWLLADAEHYNPPIHTAVIAYITRWYEGKEPEIYTFDVTPTAEELEETRCLMEIYEDAAQQDELPGKPFSDAEEHPYLCMRRDKKSGKVISRCEYYGHCWEDAVYLPF